MICAYWFCQTSFSDDKSTAPYCSPLHRRRAIAQYLAMGGKLFCPNCHTAKWPSQFYKSKKNARGYETHCNACRAQQQKDYRAKDSEQTRLRNQKYNDRPSSRLSRRAWDLAHKGTRRTYRRQYYLAHKAAHAARDARYRQTHPEQQARARQVKHARKKGAPVIENVDHLVIYQRDKWICQLCFQKVRPKEATLDHVIPLSQGGEHSARNLVLAHFSCNSRKGNRVVTQQMRLFG